MSIENGAVTGPDGVTRCPWGNSAPEYLRYHDEEWGQPVHGDDLLFERLSLEAFQSGLSWLTILRRREAFRAAFAGFSIPAVAAFGDADVARLLADVGIIRNRAKITAAVQNARLAAELDGGLDALVWSYAPDPVTRPVPVTLADVPAVTPESTALANDLRKRGFRFVGPTTVYALMQACGIVDDHLRDCHVRAILPR
jgi:DNA-3-methyladenine glycosylase I